MNNSGTNGSTRDSRESYSSSLPALLHAISKAGNTVSLFDSSGQYNIRPMENQGCGFGFRQIQRTVPDNPVIRKLKQTLSRLMNNSPSAGIFQKSATVFFTRYPLRSPLWRCRFRRISNLDELIWLPLIRGAPTFSRRTPEKRRSAFRAV